MHGVHRAWAREDMEIAAQCSKLVARQCVILAVALSWPTCMLLLAHLLNILNFVTLTQGGMVDNSSSSNSRPPTASDACFLRC